jgi:predicted nucleic acid-binding protein
MAGKIVLADTSVLIDFFRKSDKGNSYLLGLIRQDYSFCISAVTEFEIYTSANESQYQYWNDFLRKTQVLAFDVNSGPY